ncbi:MAG: peptidoglycan-binding domain-containing protein [Aliidongia sp.]
MRVSSFLNAGIGIAMIGLSGCAGTTGIFSNAFNGEAKIDDNVWLLDKDKPSDLGSRYMPPTCDKVMADLENTSEIKACTFALKQLIDVRFAHYADSLTGAVSGGNTILDVANLGFNSAGTLIGGTTSQIMNAIAGGLTAVKSKIDSDVLYTKSLELILSQMTKDRSSLETIIVTKIDNNKYTNMYEAANDLYAYDRAGSWEHALMQLQTDSNAQTASCQAEAKNAKLNSATKPNGDSSAPSKTTDGGHPGQSTGTVKCPTTGDQPVQPSPSQPVQGTEATDPATVQKAQQALNQHGAILKTDGKAGTQTKRAITEFQDAHGVKVSPDYRGKLTPETLSALKVQ